MQEFKIRASASSNIIAGSMGLTEAQTKTYNTLIAKDILTEKQTETLKGLLYKKTHPELPKGAKSYCEKWLKEQIYSRRQEFSSKYTDKGNEMEDENLDFIAKELKLGMLTKNTEFFESDFLTGTPDAIMSDTIIDVKSSWDCFTFPLFEDNIPNLDYWWQGQVYMALTGKEHYKLIYILSDTPMHLIEREARYWSRNEGYQELEEKHLEEFFNKMTYGEIPNSHKIKVYNFDKDEKAIELIKSRVIECRKYIETLINRV